VHHYFQGVSGYAADLFFVHGSTTEAVGCKSKFFVISRASTKILPS